MVWTYRGQIPDLHPECIVWKLLQALGSDHQPLVEEAANEVNNQKAERTKRKRMRGPLVTDLFLLKSCPVTPVQLGLSSTHMMSRMEPAPSRD